MLGRILLDCDGVVLPFGSDRPSADVVSAVHLWLDLNIEVVWLTARFHDVLPEAEEWGLPRLPVVGSNQDLYRQGIWYKQQLAQQMHDFDPVPFLWIDDDLRRHPESRMWVSRLSTNEFDCDTIVPLGTVGLDGHEVLSDIYDWIWCLREDAGLA